MKEQIKKAAFAALVAAFGFAAEAGDLYWQVSDIKSSPGNTLSGTQQYRTYLFASAITIPSGNNAFMKSGYTAISIDDMKALLASEDTTTATLEQYSKMGNAVRSFENTDYSADAGTAGYTANSSNYTMKFAASSKGDEYGLFGVVLDALNWEDAKYYMLLTDNGSPLTKTSATGWDEDPDTTIYDFGSQANNSWLAVPEPTSGLLLVLGMATLALKRCRV